MMKNFSFCLLALLLMACTHQAPTFTQKDIAIIPEPVKMVLKEKTFEIEKHISIANDNKQANKAILFFTEMLQKQGVIVKLNSTSSQANFVFYADKTLPKEGYKLNIQPKKVNIYASDEAGYFYAIQTIRQLLPYTIEQSHSNKKMYLPCCEIEDYPRFAWRGSHLDVSRHFFSVDEVKKVLDYLALYKINTFHLHLTDDEGWRLEIKKFPLLTEKGAWRKESSHDKICKQSAKTDSSFVIDKTKYQMRNGKKMYGGFYTQQEIRELIQYAKNRCITIVPEIDIPGHFKAAIDNYPYLSCSGKAGWGKTFSTPACLAKKETVYFINQILTEVIALFPSQYIHIGGDEVNIQSWKDCKRCQSKIKGLKLIDEHHYQAFFNRIIEHFLQQRGKQLLGWDEIVEGGITKNATAMWWRSWIPDTRDKAAKNGNDIIMTPCFQYYLNEKNENTTLKKVYDYEPIPASFSASQAKQVKGVQACLWTEWIPNFKRLQYQMFPRIMALAETGWTPKTVKDYNNFTHRLSLQYDRLSAMNIYYHIPAPNISKHVVLVDSALIDMGTIPDGMSIYYTTDGSQPTPKSKRYQQPFYVSKNGILKSIMCKGDISSKTITTKIEKQQLMPALKITPKSGKINRCVTFKRFKEVADVKLPKYPKWKPVSTINMGEYAKRSMFALCFKGYFYAKKDGVYTFTTNSDDGSLLYINNKLVVDNGKNHSLKTESGAIALKQGWHHLKITYHEAGGAGGLSVYYHLQGEKPELLQGNAIAYTVNN